MVTSFAYYIEEIFTESFLVTISNYHKIVLNKHQQNHRHQQHIGVLRSLYPTSSLSHPSSLKGPDKILLLSSLTTLSTLNQVRRPSLVLFLAAAATDVTTAAAAILVLFVSHAYLPIFIPTCCTCIATYLHIYATCNVFSPLNYNLMLHICNYTQSKPLGSGFSHLFVLILTYLVFSDIIAGVETLRRPVKCSLFPVILWGKRMIRTNMQFMMP